MKERFLYIFGTRSNIGSCILNLSEEHKKIWLIDYIKKPKSLNTKLLRLLMYILLFGVTFVFLYPFLYMLITSFKTEADLNDITVKWIPKVIKYHNYLIAFNLLSYFTYFKNSVIYTVVATIGHLLSCSFIGYGFARYEFRGKRILFIMVLVSIIVPVQTLIVPLYMIFSNIKWINTYLPVLVPTFFGFGLRGGLFIFVFRQFYLGLPRALEEAAKIDGCGFLRTYWNIALPVVKSAFNITLVLSIVWHWHDFYEPLIYASRTRMAPLSSRLKPLIEFVNNPPMELLREMSIENPEKAINNAVIMAGTCLIVIPIIIVFAFMQKQFMQGIERTGIVE